LSSLIEACGDEFVALIRGVSNKGEIIWYTEQKGLEQNLLKQCISKDPDIAVAKLWLKLNKKI
ncbi:MAG: hypothetical protein JSW40_05415, partial [Candidatus Omnitrophota bacterium]